MKYITVTISGIITAIGKPTETENYTESVIYCNIPDDSETEKWSKKQVRLWTMQNNDRMRKICDFMNENNL